MEPDVENHNQIVSGIWESCEGGGERNVGDKGVKDTMKGSNNQLTCIHRGSQRLNQHPEILHEIDVCILYICFNCVGWSSYRTANSVNRGWL